MMKLKKILSGILAVTLVVSMFAGFSVSAAAQTLPYTNNFGDSTFSPTGTTAEFEIVPQSSGTLVFEFDYIVAGGSVSAPDGLILIENTSGQKVAGWKAASRAQMYPVENGSFTSVDIVSGSWTASTYAVKIEIDLDNDKWSATVDKKWFSDLTANLSCNNAANVSKLKFAFTNTGDTIDNLKIYKKVEATQGNTEVNLLTGQSVTLGTFTVGTPAEAGMTFTSDDTSVATVNQATGVVTAVGQGSCTITTTSDAFYGYNWTYTVNVKELATGITITGTDDADNLSLVVGIQSKNEKTLSYATTPDNTLVENVAWTSDNTAVATIDATGKVTAIAQGTATITISADGTQALTDTCTVTVSNPSAITISTGSDNADRVELIRGDAVYGVKQLSATLADGTPTGSISWNVISATPNGCVTVDATGKVTAAMKGTATVEASYMGATDTCIVQVIEPLTGLTISGTQNVLDVGEIANLTAHKTPSNADANNYIWRSSNHNVVTVEGNGNTAVVKAIAKGNAEIYVSLANLYASYTITVNGDVANNNESSSRPSSLVSFSEVKGSFNDAADATWAKTAIENVVSYGIMTPDSPNSFGAKRNIKRDELVSVVIKTLALENEEAEKPVSKTFDDVDESNPYYAEIMKAVELGIISGINDTSFAPGDDITRQDLAVVVYKALEVAGVETVIGRLDFNDKADIAEYAQKAVRVLSKMYIMVGDVDGNFNPLANTTRAQVAVISENITNNVTGYTFETERTEAGEIPVKFKNAEKTLYGLGIISDVNTDGYEEFVSRERFAEYVDAFGGKSITVPAPAENDITMGEAVKMLVEMSDNVALAEYYGTYPTGYFSVASSMGITHGLNGVQAYDKITYGMAVQMLYNSMRITPGIINTVTSGGKMEYEYDAERTVLTEYLDITLKRGFVTADGFWSLNPDILPGDDGLIIDGQLYRVKGTLQDDYVGFEVNYYYHTEEEHILAVEKTNKNSKVVLRGSDITNFTSNTYFCEVDGRETKYQLDENVYIVSNYTAQMSTNVNMWPANADIVLIDSDGNKKYETVLIKTYNEIEVQILDIDKKQFVSKLGTVYNVTNDLPLRVYSNGEVIDAKKVKTGDWATIIVDANNNVREIYLSTEKIKGTVTSYASDIRKTVVCIDGEEYEASNVMVNINNMGIGVSGTFVINFRGEVAGVIIGDAPVSGTTSTQLGYLIKLRKVMGDTGDVYKAKILTEKGAIETIELIENVKVNKARVTGDIRALFGATLSNPATGEYTNVTRQVIEYTTNSEGMITKITKALPYDTQNNRISPEVQFGDYKLHESLVGTFKQYGSNFSYSIIVGDNTVLFSVPANPANENDYDFSVGRGLEQDANTDIVAYNYERNAPFADVLVIKNTRAGISGMCGGPGGEVDIINDPLMMVTKVTHEYHEDYGRGFDMIEYINIKTGAVSKKLLADNALWSSAAGAVQSYTVGSKDLKPGDLFHMSENGLGEIGTVYKHYDASDTSLVSGTGDSGSFSYVYDESTGNKWRQGGKFYEGYPVSSGVEYIITASSPNVAFATAQRSDLRFYQKHDKHTQVYKVKVNGNTVEYEKSILEAIVPSVNGNSKSVIYTSNVQLMAVIVYEQ